MKITFTIFLLISTVFSEISIISPPKLVSQFNNNIKAKYSTFGSVQYGFSTVGRIFYDPNFNGCKNIANLNITEVYKYEEIPIVLVDRGDCSFVTKARNIQYIGGKVALIINHGQDFEEILAISDDGTGMDVSITAVLIPEYEGNKIKSYLENNPEDKTQNKVTLILDNKYQNLQDKIPVEIFFNPMDTKVYRIINELFRDVVETDKIEFIPIYTFDLNFETQDYIDYLKENGRCLCGERYCEDYNLFEGNGNNILIESIRQKCIYLKAFNGDNKRSIYFNYMKRFNSDCRLNDFSINCSDKILNDINPKLVNEINECFLLSFNYKDTYKLIEEIYENCNTNIYLEEGYNNLSSLAKKGLPIIKINNQIFYGKWSRYNIYSAICSGLKEKLVTCYSLNEYKTILPSKSNSILYITSIIVVIFLMNVFIIYACKRYINRRIYQKLNSRAYEMKIDTTVNEYIQLSLRNN